MSRSEEYLSRLPIRARETAECVLEAYPEAREALDTGGCWRQKPDFANWNDEFPEFDDGWSLVLSTTSYAVESNELYLVQWIWDWDGDCTESDGDWIAFSDPRLEELFASTDPGGYVASWRKYYAYVAETGDDPLNRMFLPEAPKVPQTWEFLAERVPDGCRVRKVRKQGTRSWHSKKSQRVPRAVRDYVCWSSDQEVLPMSLESLADSHHGTLGEDQALCSVTLQIRGRRSRAADRLWLKRQAHRNVIRIDRDQAQAKRDTPIWNQVRVARRQLPPEWRIYCFLFPECVKLELRRDPDHPVMKEKVPRDPERIGAVLHRYVTRASEESTNPDPKPS